MWEKGSGRIDKVITKVKENINELTIGAEEVQAEIDSNKADVEARKIEFERLVATVETKNSELSASKELAEKVKKNMEALIQI